MSKYEESFTKDSPMKVYCNITTSLHWKDRIRVLFGKKIITKTTIYMDRYCEVAKPSDTITFVEKFIKEKPILVSLNDHSNG